MSLNRVSYLESWEQHPPPFIRQRSTASAASDDEESRNIRESTEAAFLSSSFPSSSHHRTVRHKLSFNPYAGRGWAHSSAAEPDEERRSLLRSDHGDANGSDHPAPEREGEEALTEFVFKDPNWNLAETRGAYEVSKGKRIGRLSPSQFILLDVLLLRLFKPVSNCWSSPGVCCRHLLPLCCWPRVWICSHQAGLHPGRCVPG